MAKIGEFFQLKFCFDSLNFHLGWATDLKTVPPHIVQKRILRTGDGSHEYSKAYKNEDDKQSPVVMNEHVWGWNDEKMTETDKSEVIIFNNTVKD